MNASQEILQIAKENNGVVTAAMVSNAKISRGNLKYLAENGHLERTARGVYILPETWEDEFVNLQGRYKRGVFSHETALFLLDLTDRTPNYFCMTFPKSYNLTRPKQEGVHCSTVRPEWYELGIETRLSPSGNAVRTYNAERTLCDLLRNKEQMDIQIVSEAFKKYTARSGKNIPLLSEYAKTLNVEKKLRSYLEVLL